jgi:hypothetical protein
VSCSTNSYEPYPPSTGWPAGYTVAIVNTSPPAPAPVILPLLPAILGFRNLYNSSNSHDVAFTLQDGTVHAHRVILEAQAPTLHTLASEADGLDDPIPIPYKCTEFNEMLSISYGMPPSPDLTLDALIALLKVSNYCGAVASKLYSEEALSKLIDSTNCATLADLAFTLVCPLLIQNCGKHFLSKPVEVMKSGAYKGARSNNELTQYFLELQTGVTDPSEQPVNEVRSKLMEKSCELVDLDGDSVTLAKNLKRINETPVAAKRGTKRRK